MKKENDELTNLFRTRLDHAEMPVREELWEALARDIPVVQSRRRQIMYRFTAAASVVLVLAGASAAFFYFSPQEEIADAFTQLAVSTGTTGTMGADVVTEELPAITAAHVSDEPVPVKPTQAVEEYVDDDSFTFSFSMSISYSSSTTGTSSTDTGYDRQVSYANEYAEEGNTTHVFAEEAATNETSVEKKARPWSVSAFASGGMLTDHGQHTYALSHIEDNAGAAAIKHKRPLSVGVGVRKELSDRWGLESGLVYSQLKSEATATDHSYTQDQTLHYLGIPVKADVSLYKNKRVNFYAAAGGMAEKCISGKIKTHNEEEGNAYSIHESRKPNALQLSLTAAVGIAYKLNDRLSLYAEPGLSYHFDDGSSFHSIRTEKPLNMNVLCGVRMTY